MSYKNVQEIEINSDEKIIKFSRRNIESECDHARVIIYSDDEEIKCKDCNAKVNPVWWISSHLQKLNLANRRNNEMLAEYREIFKKLESKRNFRCKKCHEVNVIDFRKLPSQAAVKRGMSVVDSEFEGWVVKND